MPANLQTSRTLNTKKNAWLAIPLILISLALLAWVDYQVIVPLKDLTVPSVGNDFSVFWTSSRTVWQGGNPYQTEPGSLFHNISLAAGGPQQYEVFLSPYYLTLFFMPFAALPLRAAVTIWIILSQICMVASIALVVKVTGRRVTPGKLLAGLGLVMLWRYTFLVMMIANISLVMLFALAASYYFSRTQRPFLAGALSAILLLKPQDVFLILPLLLIVPTTEKGPGESAWLNRQTYRRWAGFLAVTAVFVLTSFVLMPNWVFEWAGVATSKAAFNNQSLDNQMTSLRSVAAVFSSDKNFVPTLAWLLGFPLIVILVFLWWRNRSNPRSYPFVLSASIGVNILSAPYIRGYDNCLLLFSLLFCYFSLRNWESDSNYSGPRKIKVSWFCWLLILVPFPVQLIAMQTTYAYETLVPGLVILLVLFTWHLTSETLPFKFAIATQSADKATENGL